jgi:hypothetical protein
MRSLPSLIMPLNVRLALLGSLALTAVLLVPGVAWSGGAKGTTLKWNVTKSDNAVGIAIRVTSAPNAACVGTASKDGKTMTLPPLRTGDGGEGEWSWQIARGLPAGNWHVTARCSRSHSSVQPATLTFYASGGGGRRRQVGGCTSSRRSISARSALARRAATEQAERACTPTASARGTSRRAVPIFRTSKAGTATR